MLQPNVVPYPHRCSNKSECEIQATNSLFGDPCPDSSKYLEVQYRCISYSDNGLSKYPRSGFSTVILLNRRLLAFEVSEPAEVHLSGFYASSYLKLSKASLPISFGFSNRESRRV